MTPTPRFIQLIKLRKSMFREELIGLDDDGKVWHWTKLQGWGCWIWRPLNNDEANRPVFGGGDV